MFFCKPHIIHCQFWLIERYYIIIFSEHIVKFFLQVSQQIGTIEKWEYDLRVVHKGVTRSFVTMNYIKKINLAWM